MTLVIVGSILAKALKDKKLNKFVYILTICLNIVIPNIFYYMSDKEFSMKIIMYGGIIGILSAVVAFICSNSIKVMSDDEINDILIDIITDTYPEVAEVKKYSMTEYKHADQQLRSVQQRQQIWMQICVQRPDFITGLDNGRENHM